MWRWRCVSLGLGLGLGLGIGNGIGIGVAWRGVAWRGEAAWRVTLIRQILHLIMAKRPTRSEIGTSRARAMALAFTLHGEGWRGVAWRGMAWRRGVAWRLTLIRTDTTLDHSQQAKKKKRDWAITGNGDQQHAQVKEPGL